MSEPRTHYQISLTARQAVGLFAGLLVALGLAFFLGLMTGLPGRDAAAADRDVDSRAAPEKAPGAGSEPPPVETGVPLGAASGAPKMEVAAVTPISLEPSPPATFQPFEDATEEQGGTAAPGSRTSVVGAGRASAPAKAAAPAAKAAAAASKPAAPAAGKVWVQAASLSSQDEANALRGRLSKHGFHAVLLPGSGPKGKIYRVRVGPYRSEAEAARAVSKLAKLEKIREPWIVPDGK